MASTREASEARPEQKINPFAKVATGVKEGSIRRIVVCCGAGISTNAGIPDFRSPKTGLYHNLQKFDLDYPEQVFDIDFFRRRPEPFFSLSRELYPGKFTPTLTHSFLRLLVDKNCLLRCFTQNIDTLERRAGVPSHKIVEAHGSFATSRCIGISCRTEMDADRMREILKQNGTPRCPKCKALVKPDIVFFGESLPESFFAQIGDLAKADLLIVIGTSLQVQPFASLPDRVGRSCPRILINLEDVGNFNQASDVKFLKDCDTGVLEFAAACGWKDDLHAIHEEVRRRHEIQALPKTDSKSSIPAKHTNHAEDTVLEGANIPVAQSSTKTDKSVTRDDGQALEDSAPESITALLKGTHL